MKIKFQKSKLLEKLIRTMGAVSQRNTHPFTEGILIETVENGVKLSSYDMEKSVRAVSEAVVIEDGACVINAQRLLSIIKIMPEGEIVLEVNGELVVNISCGKSSFSLRALDAKDFPKMPVIAGRECFTVNQAVLKRMINKTIHSIAQADQRPVLCGAYFKLDPEFIRIVTCDSYTLALCDYKTNVIGMMKNLERSSFVVPGKTVAELVKMLSDNDEDFVTVMVTQKNIIFSMDNIVFSSRLVEGEYIDYERLIPRETPINGIVDRDGLYGALERAALISEEKIAGTAKNHVKLLSDGDMLEVSSRSVNGYIRDELKVYEHSGERILIGFNCRYLLDTVRAIDTDRVRIKFTTPYTSAIIEPIDDEAEDKYVYMILPLRMKE